MASWEQNLAPKHWIDAAYDDPTGELALDEAMLEEAETGRFGASVRAWEPSQTCVILGASGRIDDETHREVCERDHVKILRRSSGGGTVVIGPGTLNVAAVFPIEISREMRAVDEGQKQALDRLAQALRRPGVEVELRGSGDLTLGGRKFSGSAQRRMKRFVLIHATILYRFDLERVARYLKQPFRQPDYRHDRSHADFLTNLPLGRDEILRATRQAWLSDPLRPESAEPPVETVDRLVREKFADPNWIGRL